MTAFSESNGPPGASRIRKNVAVITIRSTGIDWNNRISMNRAIVCDQASTRFQATHILDL